MEQILQAIKESYTAHFVLTYILTGYNFWIFLIGFGLFNILLKKYNEGFELVKQKYMTPENKREFEIFFDNYGLPVFQNGFDTNLSISNADDYSILRTILSETEINDIKEIIRLHPKEIKFKESLQSPIMRKFLRIFIWSVVIINLLIVLT